MRSTHHIIINRRSLLHSAGRVLALFSLAGIGGLTLRKKQAADDCVIETLCQGCAIFNNCTLPKARAAQSTKKDAAHE